jgi:hypothetical protein
MVGDFLVMIRRLSGVDVTKLRLKVSPDDELD